MTPSSRSPRVGIVGGGQLGRMLALAGRPLGLRFRFLEPGDDPPVCELGEVVQAPYEDPAGLERFALGLTVATYEFENVPVEAARFLERIVQVHPTPSALEAAQDRKAEKELFQEVGIPVAPWRTVDDLDGLLRAVEELGLPAVLKSRRLGYDGKGQAVLRRAEDVAPAWESLGGRPLLLEGYVPFLRELSVLAVRSLGGEVRVYPVGENEHRDGILRRTRVPAPGLAPDVRGLAETYVRRLLERLGYVGVLAVELFQTPDGLLANELAPRVHNSGHWTQDGAVTSQFENHLRAVAGLPLGDTGLREGWAGMVNLIGGVPPREEVLGTPSWRLHLYDKGPRPGRKVGHVNVSVGSREELEDELSRMARIAERYGEG